MNILIGIALGAAFLGLFGLTVFLILSKKFRTMENTLFENLDEEDQYSRRVHCDEYSAGVFHW